MFVDGLITSFALDDGEITFAAKLVDEYGEVLWLNHGARDDHGRFVFEGDITLTFAFHEGLDRYKKRRAAGDDKAHHTVVGQGEIDGQKIVGFPASGGRIGLKPAIEREGHVPIRELA